MRRLAGLAFAVLLAACSSSEPPSSVQDDRNIHALFVGVDQYRYSDDAGFADLKGAVGDAQRFKEALADLYGVDVDTAQPGKCDSSNDTSVTLTDDCATRERILAALDGQIAALKPGDTLLFYFAGHGSQYRDDEAFDQDSGYNGTILPTDARNPDGSPGDIFDVELKERKDKATAAGIYFVSIFDSCNSATATRDGAAGQSRSVPPLTGAALPAADTPAPTGPGGGYWVHLAAAQDGEEAQETASGAVGERAGVFTNALIDTLRMPGMRDGTFGDIIKEVRLRVAKRGHIAQTPSAEGELTAAMGSRSRSPMLFEGSASGETVTLNGGALSGITSGSRFALYANQADAVAGRARLATATVVGLDDGAAELKLDAPAASTLPDSVVAEEIAHFFPADLIEVSNGLPAGPERDAADAALAGIQFVRATPDGATHLVLVEGSSTQVALRADDGTLLTDTLGEATDPAFGERLAAELQKVARVAQLLSIRTTGERDGSRAQMPVDVCIDADGYRATSCPPPQAGGVRRIGLDKTITATVINRGTKPIYLYLLAIDPRNAVDLILPKPGEFDQMLQPNQPYRRSQMAFDAAGPYRFLTIATDRPIRAEAFQQSGNGARDLAACVSPLERLLCSSSQGARDTGVTAVGDWSAQVTTALVTEKGFSE
ncbi:caspase family protein [Altererythrobacter sp. Root672]|uniref:caspase family protein n=1 Tax=Altererythrobacter sp. Root672 TaxID=1736584 RepID=UPI0007001DFC|nr:caspase family protein [Altererythrobacter sp. Root672]KRA84473.1 hypothetical protein ASD76_11010 [Altererythrobacter sp. Root672]